jgi:gluconate kinase
MAPKASAEERQIQKLIDGMPVKDEDRARWTESIQNNGMTEELAEEIRLLLSTPIDGEEHEQAVTRTRFLINFTNLVKRWRLTNQSRHFGRR